LHRATSYSLPSTTKNCVTVKRTLIFWFEYTNTPPPIELSKEEARCGVLDLLVETKLETIRTTYLIHIDAAITEAAPPYYNYKTWNPLHTTPHHFIKFHTTTTKSGKDAAATTAEFTTKTLLLLLLQ